MKSINQLLLIFAVFSTRAMERAPQPPAGKKLPTFGQMVRQEERKQEQERQEREKADTAGTLDALPAEIRLQILAMIQGDTLKEALANVKRYYIAHPPSQKSVDITKAILSYLMKKFNFDEQALQTIVNTLQKLKTMTVFQNPEMANWIFQQKIRLYREESFINIARFGNARGVKDLIAEGIDVNARDKYRETALYAVLSAPMLISEMNLRTIASEQQIYEIVSVLLEHGADVNISAVRGITPLMQASFKGLSSVVEMLLKAGANARSVDKDGDSALVWAFMGLEDALQRFPQYKSEYIKTIRLLLDAGADPNAALKVFKSDFRPRIERRRFSAEEKAELIQLLRRYGLKEE